MARILTGDLTNHYTTIEIVGEFDFRHEDMKDDCQCRMYKELITFSTILTNVTLDDIQDIHPNIGGS